MSINKLSSPTATSDLSVWLRYIENIHDKEIELGLDRVQSIAKKARLTKPAPKIITVAGTNGKGSTCAIMESILIHAGYRVGVYSSPHLINYNERIRIDGKELSNSLICQSFFAIELWRKEIPLSFFEFATLSALWSFKAHQVDIILVEVGLGGRLDATNILEHDVSVITSLALDHTDWLGEDLESIGYEKAGIFRTEKPAICGEPSPPASIAAHVDDIHADFYQVGYQFNYEVNRETETWSWKSGAFDLDDLPIPNLPVANAATAIMALGCADLELTDIDLVEGLKSATLKGRMQHLINHDRPNGPIVILDVAHNPHAASYVARELLRRFPDKKVHAVVGMLYDKDIEATLCELSNVVDIWYPATLLAPRGANSSDLLTFLGSNIEQYDSPLIAFDNAYNRASDDDLILVFGSFYTVGEVLEHWNKNV